jgi:ubiquinone/menaquinone biosynthesis C-methylase UbiE
MVRQRHPGAAPAVRASADHLPLRDGSFDAALAVLTIHHWPDWRAGLREMRRIARHRVAILTWDPGHPGFWLVQDYFPEIVEMDGAWNVRHGHLLALTELDIGYRLVVASGGSHRAY